PSGTAKPETTTTHGSAATGWRSGSNSPTSTTTPTRIGLLLSIQRHGTALPPSTRGPAQRLARVDNPDDASGTEHLGHSELEALCPVAAPDRPDVTGPTIQHPRLRSCTPTTTKKSSAKPCTGSCTITVSVPTREMHRDRPRA